MFKCENPSHHLLKLLEYPYILVAFKHIPNNTNILFGNSSFDLGTLNLWFKENRPSLNALHTQLIFPKRSLWSKPCLELFNWFLSTKFITTYYGLLRKLNRKRTAHLLKCLVAKNHYTNFIYLINNFVKCLKLFFFGISFTSNSAYYYYINKNIYVHSLKSFSKLVK